MGGSPAKVVGLTTTVVVGVMFAEGANDDDLSFTTKQ